MPSTLSKMTRPGKFFPLLLLIGLIGPLDARAGEPATTAQSGEIYRAFNAAPRQLPPKPQRNDQEPPSSYLEEAPRFSKPARQTAPLSAVIEEAPAKKSPLREPARLFDDDTDFSEGRPIATAPSARRSANPIATQGAARENDRVRRVNHLRAPEEPTNSLRNESSPGKAPAYERGLYQVSAQQVPAQDSGKALGQESDPGSTPLPESSLSSQTRLPPEGESNQNENDSGGFFPMLMTMGGALLLVIGLFLVFAWMMRRTSMRSGGMLPQGVIEVLGHQVITGRQQVHLLRIGKRLLLVSVSPDSIETLTEITDPMEVDRIAGICRQSGPGSSTGAFQSVMRQFSQDATTTQEPTPTVDQLRQRLGS